MRRLAVLALILFSPMVAYAACEDDLRATSFYAGGVKESRDGLEQAVATLRSRISVLEAQLRALVAPPKPKDEPKAAPTPGSAP